ncbi:MAG: Ig-like domain-containing protein [Ruegeria sp.]
MTDGRELVIAAEDIQVLENGTIMVAEEVAVQISQFAAVAEAGAAAATAGGISGTGLALGGLGVAGAAAAAGGGGGGSGDDPETRTDETVREPVASPPAPLPPSLNLAELQNDALNSFSTGVSAPENAATVEVTIGGVTKLATPNVDGSWQVSLSQAEAGSLPQGVSDVAVRILDADSIELSSGGAQFDVDTVPPTLTISPVSGDGVLNALEQGADLTVSGTTDAENGQMVTVSLNGETYTTTASGGNWNVSVPAADLQGLTDGETIAITADVSDRAGNPATQANIDFDTDFTDPTVSLDPVSGGSIDLVDVRGDLALTGTTTAEDGQIVTVTFEGREYTAPATGGVWIVTIPQVDLTGLTTGSPVSVSFAVQDAAGNPAIPASANVPVDLTGPSISIAPLAVGNILNAAETGSPLTVTGSTGNVSDGQQVTVELNGQTYTGSVSGDSWSVTIPAVDLDALADGQGFTLTADVTDSDGLLAPQADVLLSKDVTAPTLSIDSLSHGAVLNAAERGSDLTISGATSAEDGQEITVTLNGQTYSGTAQSGSWFVTVPSGDLASLPDGAAITVLADVSDVAGNPAVQASDLFNTDFTAPTLAIDPLAVGAVMNASERASDFVISGASDAVDGTSVSIEIVRSDNTVEFSGTATVSAGSWTFTVPSGNLSSLQDAETYDVNASVSDAAGNNSAASTSIATDFSAPTLSMDPLDVGSAMDVIERGADLTVSGTTSAEDSQVVAVTLDGQVYNASISGGVWTVNIPSANLAALSDGQTYTVSASVQDANGNEAINADTSFSTNFKPVLSLDPLGTNDAVLLSDAVDSGVIVSGQSAGLLAGQAIDITLNGSSIGTATVAADGSWSANVPGPAFAGITEGDTLDFAARATVAGGPDPDPVSDQVTAYTPAPYVISEVGRSGSTITFAIHTDPDQDVSAGLGFDADLGFDPAIVAFNAGSNVEHDDFAIFSVNDSSNPVRFGGAALSISDLSQPLVTFEMTILDADQPIELEITSLQGGPLHVTFETLREFFTSATLVAVVDLPFVVVFILTIYMVGGPLALIPTLAVPIVLLTGLAIQPLLGRLAEQSFADGQSKQGVLVETVSGLETIKTTSAARQMRNRWEQAMERQSEHGTRSRAVTQLALNLTGFTQQAAQVLIVFLGVFLVTNGQASMGALVAAVMLTGRALAPLGQLAQTLTRVNQARSAFRNLNALMQAESERPQGKNWVSRASFDGRFTFNDVHFAYPDQSHDALKGVTFTIKPGEKVAILGQIGSGKSTIARLMLGLYQPRTASIMLDGLDIRQIDPGDLRRSIGSVLQDLWLFSGSVRENISSGSARPTDTDLIRAGRIAGVEEFVAQHPSGYDLELAERGEGLSGGQRQAICLARALIGRPNVLLMDEPTSAMDIKSEAKVIQRLKAATQKTTLVLVTHRSSMLELVDRVIVIEDGKIAADGPKSILSQYAATGRRHLNVAAS